jgi:hypothetical protein
LQLAATGLPAAAGVITLKIRPGIVARRRPLFFFPPLIASSPMKFSPAFGCLAIAAAAFGSGTAQGQDAEYESARRAARLELQIALNEFRDYRQIVYPRIRRDLDARIALTELEVRTLRERWRMYDPFNRFSTGSAVTWALQDLRMCFLEAELRLRDLWAERSNLVRFRTPEWRALELRVHEARLEVAAIEAEAENAEDVEELPAG